MASSPGSVRGLSRRLSRRHILGFSGSAILIVALGGCQAASPTAVPAAAPTAAAAAPAQAPAAAPTPAPPVAAPATQAQQVTLNFWAWGTPEMFDGMKNGFATYEQQSKKYTVEFFTAPYNEFYQKLNTRIAGGESPDASMFDAAQLVDFVDRGAIESIERRFRESLKPDDYFTQFWDDLYRIPFGSGELYSLPLYMHTYVMSYNVDMFDKAGVAHPSVNWTWQDIENAAQRLTNEQTGEFGWGWQWQLYHHLTKLYQAGGKLTNDERTRILVDSPESIEAIDSMIRLNKLAPPAEGELTALKIPMILTGKVAMEGTSNLRTNSQPYRETKVNWKLTPFPAQKLAGGPKVSTGYADGMVVYKASPEKDAAWELLTFLLSNDFQAKQVATWGPMPILRSAKDAFAQNNIADKNPNAAYEQLDYMRSWPMTTDWGTWIGEVYGRIGEGLRSGLSAQEIAANAARDGNQKLEAALKRQR